MVLPVVAYGVPVLRKMGEDITPVYPDLTKLISDMWDTMYYCNGVGLAAPQINRAIRLFVVDSKQIVDSLEDEEKEEFKGDEGIKQVFINAHIKELKGDLWSYSEGCLSIPKLRDDVWRQEEVVLEYCDENFEKKISTFTGITARVILHEYDHIDGKLFIDHIKPLKRKMWQGKLDDISKGKVRTDYRMVFTK
jgi:peptide deformylase